MVDFEQLFSEQDKEFDWFPSELHAFSTPDVGDEYDQLYDLRIEVSDKSDVFLREELCQLDLGEIVNPEGKQPFSETLSRSLNENFGYVAEKLTGSSLHLQSENLYDAIQKLEQKCEILKTSLRYCSDSELKVRLQQCREEEGLMIGALDNRQLLELWNAPESPMLDCGIRICEVVSVDEHVVTVKDHANAQILQIPCNKLSNLEGILLEVLK